MDRVSNSSVTEQADTPGTVRIRVDWDVALTSPNGRFHPRARRENQRASRGRARVAWMEAGRPMIDGPVDVTVVSRRSRALDPDNLLSALKHVSDYLLGRGRPRNFGEGVVWDDGPKWVRWQIEQETGSQWAREPHVEYVIVPREET